MNLWLNRNRIVLHVFCAMWHCILFMGFCEHASISKKTKTSNPESHRLGTLNTSWTVWFIYLYVYEEI